MENSRSSRYAVTKKTGKVTSSSDKSLGGKAKKNVMKVEVNRPDSPEFFGFSNADIPQPIVIKTEPVEDAVDDDDCVVVEVSKGAKPIIIKKEKEDFDDMDTFHGFSLEDIPRPIVIKEEPQEDVSVERAETASIPEFFIKTTETLVENTDTSLEDTGTETLVETTEIIVDDTETTKEDLETPVSQKSTIPVDTLIDEFEMGGDPVVDAENNDVKNVDQENQDPESEIKIKEIVSVSVPSTTKTLSAEKSSEEISSSESSFVVIHDQGKCCHVKFVIDFYLGPSLTCHNCPNNMSISTLTLNIRVVQYFAKKKRINFIYCTIINYIRICKVKVLLTLKVATKSSPFYD